MKKGLTELVFILDRSGSMEGLEGDTIGGFNSMIRRQKEQPGECLVSTVLFDTYRQTLHDRLTLQNVPNMTASDYCVRGCTALVDAIGSSIHHIASIHRYIREEDVPERTLFVITTDGMENASREYTAQQVRDMIKKQESCGWEFLFLGANMDAVSTAASFGIHKDRATTYTNDSSGIATNYEAISSVISSFREKAPVTENWKDMIDKDHSGRV